MFHGNITKSETENIVHLLKHNINYKMISTYPKYNIIKLVDRRFMYLKKSTNKNENDSVVVSMYQFGKMNYKLYLLVEVLQNMIEEPFFDQLRTKEQLGYIVGTRVIYLDKILSLVFEIQSSVKGPNYLLDRIDDFLKNFRRKLIQMNDSQFDSYIRAVTEIKKMKFINMEEEFSFNCAEVQMGEYIFNRKTIDVNYLKKLKKKHIIKLYDRFITKNKRNLVIKIFGKSEENEKCDVDDPNAIQIKSIEKFKSGSHLFM